MTVPDATWPVDRWAAEGRRISGALDAVGAAVIFGPDADAAARVALGIAQLQCAQRRVAIGDLVGDGPLMSVAAPGDAHGLVDSFLYGVSLNHIARPVPGKPNLFVLPCGTEPPTAEVLSNPRWRRLAAGFREMGALLLLVPPPATAWPGPLVGATDGVVLVGGAMAPPGVRVLARADLRDGERRLATSASFDGAAQRAPDAERDAERGADRGDERGAAGDWLAGAMTERRRTPRPSQLAAARPLLMALVGAALVGVGIWLGRRGATADADLPAVAAPAPARVIDSAAAGIGSAGSLAALVVNEADSAQAAAWGIEILATNTEDGAMDNLGRSAGRRFPAATVSPVRLAGDTAPWYRVIVGAERTRTAAESLLAKLRAEGTVSAGAGQVVRVPFAVRLAANVPPDSADTQVEAMWLAGTPAYALRQPDGTQHLYLGAFDAPQYAAALAETLRGAGVAPAVVYRTGRPF